MTTTNTDLIKTEANNLAENVKANLQNAKALAVSEAWKILQLATASVVQIIEKLGQDLSGPEKKKIAIDALSNFYDKVFVVIDIPFVPNILEPLMHKYIKAFLMILVGASIDALVTTFRETGIFIKKQIEA